MDKFLHNKCNVTCELKNDTTTIIAMSVSVEPAKYRKVKKKQKKNKRLKKRLRGSSILYRRGREGKGGQCVGGAAGR